MAFGAGTTFNWAQPAVGPNGAGNYACPVTSGDYTILLGGYDQASGATVATVSTIQYLGGGSISGPSPQPSLPQGAWNAMGCATADTVIFAGGINGTSFLTSVWTASWDAGTGTVGAWTAQASLPQATVVGGMAAWGSTVYVVGGNTTNDSSTNTANVYYASAVNGQIQSWTAGPPLPRAISSAYVAVAGDRLIVAGGRDTSGTSLSTVYYSPISADGSLGGWKTGPSLPQVCFAYAPNWNLVVTGSAMVIISGPGTSTLSLSPACQILTVTADGPARAWQQQNPYSGGEYHVAYYPSGSPGELMTFNLHMTTYEAVPLAPLPLISVPLPASGLTAGGTYHIVAHQNGGDLNDYTQIALLQSALPSTAQTRPNGGGPWAPLGSSYAVPAQVFDQTPGGPVLYLWEDSGARVTSLIYATASGQFLGVCEATAFADGTMLAEVAQVTYSGTTPVGVVQLA